MLAYLNYVRYLFLDTKGVADLNFDKFERGLKGNYSLVNTIYAKKKRGKIHTNIFLKIIREK